MSKSLKTAPYRQQGSALIAVLSFITLMTIAMAGFLGVARNIVSQETIEMNDDKAFLAAESGLLAGSRLVLSQYTPYNFVSQSDIFGQSLRNANSINGIDVTVSTEVDGPTITVTSIASNASMITYKKKMSWVMTMIPKTQASGTLGVYLDNAYQLGGNTKGMRKMDWDGPAHFNTALQLGNPGNGNETHFYGPVSLYNIDPATNLQLFDPNNGTGHFGNDYRYGVTGGSGSWDSEFKGKYDPMSTKLATIIDTADHDDLYLNAGDSSLTFGVTGITPHYKYKNAAGSVITVNYDSAAENKLHIVNKGVAVSGSVKGKILVYTDIGKSVYIPGNLTYADFQTSSFSDTSKATNSGYGMNRDNVLALYSGADLIVSQGTHYISGQLFAVTAGTSTITFENDKKNKTKLNLFGTLAVNGFWDAKQGNDQADFVHKWDRRQKSAPGLTFKTLDINGQTVYTCIYSRWTDSNIL